MDVRVNIGRSTPCQLSIDALHTATPHSAMHNGMSLAAILDSSRKGGNLLLFLNN